MGHLREQHGRQGCCPRRCRHRRRSRHAGDLPAGRPRLRGRRPALAPPARPGRRQRRRPSAHPRHRPLRRSGHRRGRGRRSARSSACCSPSRCGRCSRTTWASASAASTSGRWNCSASRLLAVFTGVMAALVPAITASRQSVLASLTGRRGVRKSNRVLPVIGLIAVAARRGHRPLRLDDDRPVRHRRGRQRPRRAGRGRPHPGPGRPVRPRRTLLPLSPRLALRDAVRNRGRTAPAVAAVLAAVAGTVAVATYAASSDAQSRADYEAQLPHGAVSVTLDEAGGRDVPSVRATVQKMLPVDVRADVDRVAVGKASCSMYSDAEGCGRYEVVVPLANECPLWSDRPGPSRPGPVGEVQQGRAAQARRRLALQAELGRHPFRRRRSARRRREAAEGARHR